ncbi:non-specific lipid-transfer protein-like [Gastrolobium bilobum]|uniref:non-specific lipid-transfer protein-like n=1 Tax=Gastrolobium bilobum TaxID=150636 RepID=UPI002AB13FB6|nr:non-specific lipid-transfer protein-like [Gastrolobium bilobum]
MKMPRAATIHRLAWLLSIVILLLSSEATDVSISCPTVFGELAPCTTFLQQNSPKMPSQACCSGVKKLSGEATTKKDLTAICQCLKQGLATIGKYDPNRIPQLTKDCGVSLTFPPIDQNTDCTKSKTILSSL